VITPRVVVGKATDMFYKNVKVLIFADGEYKGPIVGNYNIGN
jgi:hypothetical protein